MRNSSAKILIFSILFVAVFAIIASCLFITVQNSNTHTCYSNEETNIVSLADVTNVNGFNSGYLSNGDGLADGEVPSGYSPTTTGYTAVAISTDDGLQSFLNDNSGKYGYLTTSFETTITFGNFYELSGVLDGCGNTLTMNTDYTNNPSNSYFYGGLVYTLTGTIKNLRVETTADYHSTRTDNTNNSQGAGLLVGTMSSGLIDNVYLQWKGASSYFNHVKSRSDKAVVLGGLVAKTSGTETISNTTVEIDEPLINQGYSSYTLNRSFNIWTGGFVGENSGGTLTLTNITIAGDSNITSTRTDNDGNAYGDTGAIVGWVSGGSITVNGCMVKWTGQCTSSCNQDNKIYVLCSNASYSNVYYGSGDTNWYTRSGKTVSVESNTALQSFSISNSLIGFCHKNTGNIWIGDSSQYSTTGSSASVNHNIHGRFVKTIQLGNSTVNVASLAANGVGTNKSYVPMIAKTSVTGTIGAATNGSYAYLENEATSMTVTYSNSTNGSPTLSDGVFSAVYNGYAITGISVNEKIYQSGAYTSNTSTLSSWTSSPSTIKDVNSYTLTKTQAGFATGDYFLVTAASYTETLNITKASARTDASSNYSGTYDGSAHYITCNATGFLGSDTFDNAATVYYSAISEADASTTNNTTNIGITHVSDSGIIYYRIEFDNYDTITGSKTITITPAAVAFGNSYSGVNHYTYTGLSLVNNNAYTSTGLQFFCNILSTAQTVTAQSPLLSYSTMFEDNILTFISSSSDSIVKDWKNGGYTFAIASNQSEGETDFSIQGEISFNYYIDKVGLTVTANDKTITYGDAPATNGVSYSGFVNNEGTNLINPSISCSTSYTQYGNVGTYAIVPSGTISATNYEVGTLVNGTLTVSKKAITITANDKTITYGDAPSDAGVEYSGLVTGEGDTLHNLSGTITYSYSYIQYDPVGNYDITPSGITSTNYSITFVDGVLTVNKKAITITANNKKITYGDAPANNGVSASGLVNGDTASVLSGVTYSYSYHQYDDVGTYTITPGGTITATNYTVTGFVNGTLTVGQAPLRIKFNDTKDLYDSIIDYYNNNYDFIYVETNTTTHTSSLTSSLRSNMSFLQFR